MPLPCWLSAWSPLSRPKCRKHTSLCPCWRACHWPRGRRRRPPGRRGLRRRKRIAGRCRSRTRRRDGAEGWLYRGLGAERDLRRADARLRRYGVRRGRSGRRGQPTAGWDALTPTETKIALLVADGRSNPDIATKLFMSRNTVQTHVSHILTKLDARSRIEVARQALQQANRAQAAG